MSKVIAAHHSICDNGVTFKTLFREDQHNNRSFEIIASDNASDSYEEIYSHDFYTDSVIPWSQYKMSLNNLKLETLNFLSDIKSNIVQFCRFQPKQ